MRNKKHWIILMIVIIIVSTTMLWLIRKSFDSDLTSNQNQKIMIASILSLTGPAGLIGQEILAGQKIAVDYWNSLEGPRVEFIAEDSKGLPKEGLSAYHSLNSRGYSYFIANISGVTLGIKPEIQADKTTLLAIASHPAVTSPAKHGMFRYSQTAQEEARILSDWIIKYNNSKQIVVLFHSANDYGQAFSDIMKTILIQSEIDMLSSQYRVEDISNMRSLMHSVLPNSSYLPVVVGAGHPMAQIISTLRIMGYQGPILANIGYALTGVREQLAGEEGKILYLTLNVCQNKHTLWATKRYNRLYGKEISPDALIGFNSVSIIVTTCRSLKKISPIDVNRLLPEQTSIYFEEKKAISNNEIIVKVRMNEN